MQINPTNTAGDTLPLFSALSLHRKFLPLLIAACLSAAGSGAALANPTGPVVVNGQVMFSQQGNVFSITNSPNAIINWSSFSIQQGEITRFIQESSNSSVLNRITGQDPSRIMGALQSNGRVFLINPNGILFGSNAQVNVNGLVASSLAISNTDFLAGKNKFTAGAVAGDVSNLGAITTPAGGQVLLIAPNVSNSGIITSPQGEVMLAAGQSVQLADSANPGMHVVVSAPTDQAINLGQVIAQGGKIGVYGTLVNQRGTLNANSAVVGENGKIVLKASRTTLLEAGSVTTATGADTGGEIQVLGEQVGLTGDAHVDASGQNGGGTVLIGGDYQGKNASVMNAQQVYVGKDAEISANAVVRGNGGKVIVWGNQTAQVFGTISARGGMQSGNGGFVETSGHFLDVAGIHVNAGAANGQKGTWLLDPYDIYVGVANDSVPLSDVAAFATPSQVGNTSYVNGGQISDTGGANVTLQATHNITFAGEIDITTAGVGLTAQAGNDINVFAPITINGGALVLSANDNGWGTASGVGKVNVSALLTTHGGSLTLSPPPTPPPTPPPSADICTIAPNSALCQVLSPPTASERVKPVQKAINSTINVINLASAAPVPVTASPRNAPAGGNAGNGTSSASTTTSSASDDQKSEIKKDEKKDTLASKDSGAKKDEPVKKMYCN
jgi:filamentous hemagglutinin family protein